MTNIPLGRDYNSDGINDFGTKSGDTYTIFAGGAHKMDPDVVTIFSGTLVEMQDAGYGDAAAKIDLPSAATPASTGSSGQSSGTSKTLRQDKGLEGNIYGGGEN